MLGKPLKLFRRIRDGATVRWWHWIGRRLLHAHGVELEGPITLYGLPIIEVASGSRICIGLGAVLCSKSRFTALSVAKPVTLRTLREGAEIRLGRDCGLSGTVICAAIAVHVGDRCLFGADVQIADTDFHPINPKGRRFNNNSSDIRSAPIRIGQNVFIGTRSIILKGVAIGDDAVIGAGSVVTRDVPTGAIAAGSPARIVGSVYQ